MRKNSSFSILFPDTDKTEFRQLSDETCHDLGLDTLCAELTSDKKEQQLIMNIISNMTADPETSVYRKKIFADILRLPELRTRLLELFEKVEFIRNFSVNRLESDEKKGLWHLLHRLDELNDYIRCVDEMKECLSEADITSEGLTGFRNYIETLYNDSCFAEMKKDVAELKKSTANIQSVTIGVNVNERFEAVSMGLVSVNSKPFKKSGILSNFADAVSAKNKIQDDTEWDGNMRYHQVEKENSGRAMAFAEKLAGFRALQSNPFVDGKIRSTIVNAPDGDGINGSTFYLENILNKMLDTIVRRLRDVLTKYADITIINIARLIPEFIYYIRFAEFTDSRMKSGFNFCEAEISENESCGMNAEGFYNLKLALSIPDKNDLVVNNLVFDREHTIYILTGANRGGKTTVTQAIGLLYVLAQGGIFVPSSKFEYKPLDCIYTHFPADEDKTMNLGRLGEECVRFKEIFKAATSESLVLLNESFSTTSFEEGYYIARDSVKALQRKRIRTIYNTHMHKLASDTNEYSKENENAGVCSLVVRSENGKRSFRIETAQPEGLSYARDIAEKYGVTYEMLTEEM